MTFGGNLMKKRLLELDILRGFAFILVVVEHTLGGYSYSKDISTSNLFITRFIYTMSKPAVVIFLALTAMGLVYTYYDKFNLKSFYIKKLKFLVIPYIIFSFLNIVFLKHTDRLKSFIAQIVTGNAAYHLWYMAMTLRVYLFFPLILLIIRKINRKSISIKAGFFISYFLGYWWLLKNDINITNFLGTLIFKNPDDLQQRFINITPVLWSLYFVVGVYIILNYDKFKALILKYKKIVAALYGLTLAYNYYDEIRDVIGNPLPYIKFNYIININSRILSILFFYIVSVYILNKRKILSKLLMFIGKYSFPAYMFHIVVIQYIVNNYHQTKNLYSPMLLLIETVMFTTIIFYVINYLPYSEYAIGIKSKPKINFASVKNSFKHIFSLD